MEINHKKNNWKMRIGILTFHFAHNYGAVIQAYGIRFALEKLGHEVCFIDYRPRSLAKKYTFFSLYMYKGKPFSLRLKMMFDTIKHTRQRLHRINSFKQFVKQNFPLLPINKVGSLDLIVIGSDQVWNPKITDGYDEIYYGGLFNQYKIPNISYAASCPAKTIDMSVVPLIKRFKAIGVRETVLKEKLEKLGLCSTLTIDPSLLINKEEYGKVELKKRIVQERYLFIYTLGDNAQLYDFAKKISKKYSLKVAANSRKEKFPDFIYDAEGPQGFLNLIKYADYCLVSSFHGVAFSIIYQKKFIYFPFLSDKDERVFSLLEAIGLTNCIYSKNAADDFPAIDWSITNEKIKYIRDKSFDYLREQTYLTK